MNVHSLNFYIYLPLSKRTYEINNIEQFFDGMVDLLDLEVMHKCRGVFDSPIEGYGTIAHSGIYLLTTSHLAWHTYPEDRRIHVSLSTCGKKPNLIHIQKYIGKNLSEMAFIEHIPCLS